MIKSWAGISLWRIFFGKLKGKFYLQELGLDVNILIYDLATRNWGPKSRWTHFADWRSASWDFRKKLVPKSVYFVPDRAVHWWLETKLVIYGRRSGTHLGRRILWLVLAVVHTDVVATLNPLRLCLCFFYGCLARCAGIWLVISRSGNHNQAYTIRPECYTEVWRHRQDRPHLYVWQSFTPTGTSSRKCSWRIGCKTFSFRNQLDRGRCKKHIQYTVIFNSPQAKKAFERRENLHRNFGSKTIS